jgi:hypothetical protein
LLCYLFDAEVMEVTLAIDVEPGWDLDTMACRGGNWVIGRW